MPQRKPLPNDRAEQPTGSGPPPATRSRSPSRPPLGPPPNAPLPDLPLGPPPNAPLPDLPLGTGNAPAWPMYRGGGGKLGPDGWVLQHSDLEWMGSGGQGSSRFSVDSVSTTTGNRTPITPPGTPQRHGILHILHLGRLKGSEANQKLGLRDGDSVCAPRRPPRPPSLNLDDLDDDDDTFPSPPTPTPLSTKRDSFFTPARGFQDPAVNAAAASGRRVIKLSKTPHTWTWTNVDAGPSASRSAPPHPTGELEDEYARWLGMAQSLRQTIQSEVQELLRLLKQLPVYQRGQFQQLDEESLLEALMAFLVQKDREGA